MSPNDFPDNVIPLRPRRSDRAAKPAGNNAPAAIAGGTTAGDATATNDGARPVSLAAARSAAGLHQSFSRQQTEPASSQMLPKERLQGGAFQERRQERWPASGGSRQLAVTPLAVRPFATHPLATQQALPEAETVAPPEREAIMPTSKRGFRWSSLAMILAAAFVLGIVVAGGAVAIGAHVLNVWPHGFPLYAMVIGGGLTMTLTAALMTALFYSDSSGHDESVYQFHPDKRGKQNRDDDAG